MKLFLLTASHHLLKSATGVRGGHEQSLISRARFPDFPPSAMKNMIVGQPFAPMLPSIEPRQPKQALPRATSHSSIFLELRIPTSLQKIQASKTGPLSSFLDTLQDEFCKASELSNNRLQLMGIRGEYTRVPLNESHKNTQHSYLKQSRENLKQSMGWQSQIETMSMADQHVIVEIEILPGDPRTPGDILTTWKTQLATPGSFLLQGPLGLVLKGASIQAPPVSMSANTQFEKFSKSAASSHQVLALTFALICVVWHVA